MKKGLLHFLTAILMIMTVLVIMTNSPPADRRANVNTVNSSTTAVIYADGTYVANANATNFYSSSYFVAMKPLPFTFGVKREKNSIFLIQTAQMSSVTMSEDRTGAMVKGIPPINQTTVLEVTAAKKEVSAFSASVNTVEFTG